MSKRLLIFVLMVHTIGVVCTYADKYTLSQSAFRRDINQFLIEEGYSTHINSETGDINFKMDDTNYVIDLNTDFNGPFLVTLSATFGTSSGSDSSKQRFYETSNTINSRYNCVKVCYLEYQNEGMLVFSVESFCHNSDDFKYALVKYLNIIKSAISEFTNLYDDSSEDGNDVIGRVSSRLGNRIIIETPILETSHHKWWATSIVFNQNNVVVNKIVLPKVSSTYVQATHDEYIEDCDTGKRYYITHSSIGLAPERTVLMSKEAKSFYDTYQLLPSSVKRISIWSGSDYYVKNLKIR